jgi:hypothetical protein
MRLPTVERAATPATIPTIPAEASRLVPAARAWGKVSSMQARARTTMVTIRTRPSTWIWVRARRARRLSGTSTS